MKTIMNAISIFVAMFLLFGCSAGQMTNVQQSGFLHDYSNLHAGGENEAVLVFVNPDADFRDYDKIMFERVTVWYSDDADYQGIDPDILKRLTDHFQQALLDSVEGYQIVDQPGPGVLWVRAAITDVKPSKPTANTVSTILPVGWVVAGSAKAISGDNLAAGEAAAEIEVLDSVSGERLAAAVDRRQGGKSAFQGKWKDTEEALEYWAKKFRVRLDELRGEKP